MKQGQRGAVHRSLWPQADPEYQKAHPVDQAVMRHECARMRKKLRQIAKKLKGRR